MFVFTPPGYAVFGNKKLLKKEIKNKTGLDIVKG